MQASLPSNPQRKPTITGQKLLEWLKTDRKQSASGASQTAEGMLKMKLIQPSQVRLSLLQQPASLLRCLQLQ